MSANQSDAPLEVTIEQRQGKTFVITPRGRIDSETYNSLEEKVSPLLAKETKAVIFDMAGVDYISSAGLVVIFNTKKYIESNSGKFILTNLQPQVKKVFDIVKALSPQNIFESMEEADRYLAAMQRQEIERQKQRP